MSHVGQAASAPPRLLQPERSAHLTAFWNPHRPETRTTNIPKNTVRIQKSYTQISQSINQKTRHAVWKKHGVPTWSVSWCRWRECSSVARWCVSARRSDWMAAEEEASTWDFSWSPKVCSCCRACCTEAWSSRHACNNEAIRKVKVKE